MAQPPGHQKQAQNVSNSEDTHVNNKEASQYAQRGARKRTKTGCLTCRKRRIKCGEEKPICSNCTKSKRYCEGYHPRIIFRQPASGLGSTHDPSNSRSSLLSHLSSVEGYPSAFSRLNTGVSSQALRPIAPTPLQGQQQNHHAAKQATSVPSSHPFPHPLSTGDFLANPSALPLPANALDTFQAASQDSIGEGATYPSYEAMQRNVPVPVPHLADHSWAGTITAGPLSDSQFMASTNAFACCDSVPSVSTSRLLAGALPLETLPEHVAPYQSILPNNVTTSLTSTQIAALGDQPLPSDHPFYSEAKVNLYDSQLEEPHREHDPKRYTAQGFVQRPSFPLSIPTSLELPSSALASTFTLEENGDADDPWDVEMEFEEGNNPSLEQSKEDFNVILVKHASSGGRQGLRSFTRFLNDTNVLASYSPSYAALPQADEKAARIFCHFVSSTGPSLTIFERSVPSPSVSAGISAIAGFKQPLWTFTLPCLALQHPPLMHAILALSALHISKLQQTSPGPSIKHFTYALRRVGRLIGLPHWRNEVTTFAANLLLGFYEVMSAETSKWNIHLTGARVLAMEIDFAGKTRKIRALRAEAKSRLAQLDVEHHSDYIRHGGIPESLFPDRDWEVDENLISTFMGYHVRYDYQYQNNASQATQPRLNFTSKDVELYKMQADLYWWYCKQDIFQSMISGNRLLMRYDHWVFCPPRGQLGQLDIIYATMDHLCLILARLADFGGKDQVRKRRMTAAQSSSTSQSASHMNATPSSGRGPPMGYMPTANNPTPMHSAFDTMTANLYDPSFSPPAMFEVPLQTHEAQDIEAETVAALAEHSAIFEALDIFERSLPREYDPLPPDAAPPISTPFGPALQYRTHTISCIWAFYYAGRILLHRLHPHMPPAAMISAQAAAAQTAPYAQKIGKICAGLYYPQRYNLQTGSLNPSLGGALIESTFSLFFAAIQFQDQAQRGWTINKLKEIARLSGWQTAAAVAAGCEFAWEATGKAGRGPPYRPTMDWRNKDERVGDKVMKRAAKAQQRERAREKQRQQAMEKGKATGGEGQNIGEQQDKGDGEEVEDEEEEEEEEEEDEAAVAAAAEERRRKEREEQYFIAAGKDGRIRRPKKSSTGFLDADGSGAGVGQDEPNPNPNPDLDLDPDLDLGPDPDAITHDRESIGTNPFARTHWALGLLSLDEDIAKIDLGKG